MYIQTTHKKHIFTGDIIFMLHVSNNLTCTETKNSKFIFPIIWQLYNIPTDDNLHSAPNTDKNA